MNETRSETRTNIAKFDESKRDANMRVLEVNDLTKVQRNYSLRIRSDHNSPLIFNQV